MAVNPKHVKCLIEELSLQTGCSTVHKGFAKMSEAIPVGARKSDKMGLHIDQRYLYETYKKAKKAFLAGITDCRFYESHLDLIAVAVNKKNFRDFVASIEKRSDPLLKKYEGNWWSIVRGNVGNCLIKAPLRIYNDPVEGMCLMLTGKETRFKGTVQLRSGCLFCELDSVNSKKLYIVMKGNNSGYAQVLQGTFSGISSTGDPIGGRELFVRENAMPFEEMEWEKLALKNLLLDIRICKYFEKAESNCIKIDNRIDLE